MKRLLSIVFPLLAVFMIFSGVAFAQAVRVYGSTGVDISWANCGMTIPVVSFGIVGVNDGTNYSENPCLAKEASRFINNLSLYANTGWDFASVHNNASSPKQCNVSDENCLAYNYGYNAGLYAISYANSQRTHSTKWWLDVELSNTWSSTGSQNQSSLQGESDALSANGVNTVGIYSTTIQWDIISGDWLNNWPSWGATTWTSSQQAKTYCAGHEFTGGPSYLMQFKSHSSKLDQDVSC